MISEIHSADEHAPFPHKLVTGTGREIVRIGQPPKKVIKEYPFTYIICAICRHYVNGSEAVAARCNCRASCHDTYPRDLVS